MKKHKTWIQYAVLATVVLTLYLTGLHTEVIAFAQRGVLATGIMNPDVTELTEQQNSTGGTTTLNYPVKANFNVDLKDKDGNVISLSTLKGKVVFINLWATWCPPCIAEMPSIDKLHQELGDEVAFVILSLDQDFKNAVAFNKRKGYNLPIYSAVKELPASYQSAAIPTTYVIDKEGNIVLTHKGMANYDSASFKAFLKRML